MSIVAFITCRSPPVLVAGTSPLGRVDKNTIHLGQIGRKNVVLAAVAPL